MRRILICNGMVVLLLFFASNKSIFLPVMNARTYHYLALGDSYTIGESVPSQENFPNQLTSMLNKLGYSFSTPRIVAKTGWTTDELEKGIEESGKVEPFRGEYELVTLLIGVNNQYRGRPDNEYKTEFEGLLRQAIAFSGNKPQHVVVVSIPDWGVTPFANGRDREMIAREIDEYNDANREITSKYEAHYIDITPWTREAVHDQNLLAADGLHPSGEEYKRWSEKIAALVTTMY